MSIQSERALADSGLFGRGGLQGARIPADFQVVGLFSLLGLAISALAIAMGFGPQIAELLSIAG